MAFGLMEFDTLWFPNTALSHRRSTVAVSELDHMSNGAPLPLGMYWPTLERLDCSLGAVSGCYQGSFDSFVVLEKKHNSNANLCVCDMRVYTHTPTCGGRDTILNWHSITYIGTCVLSQIKCVSFAEFLVQAQIIGSSTVLKFYTCPTHGMHLDYLYPQFTSTNIHICIWAS